MIGVHEDVAVNEGGSIAWAFREGSPQLKSVLDDFIRTHGKGTVFGNTLLKRYLQSAKYVKEATNEAGMRKFNATVALWLSAPEVPVSVTVAAPVATEASAAKVIFCATPGISGSVAGFAVTPAGNPPGETVTVAANPFIAVAITLIDCPAARVLRRLVW